MRRVYQWGILSLVLAAVAFAFADGGTDCFRQNVRRQIRDEVRGPYTCFCRLSSDGEFNLPSGVWTTIPMTYEETDKGNWHDNTVNNTRFNVPWTGVYMIRAQWQPVWPSTASGNVAIRLKKNGLWYTGVFSVSYANSFAHTVMYLQEIELQAGDYIELGAYQNTGSSIPLGVSTRIEIVYLPRQYE